MEWLLLVFFYGDNNDMKVLSGLCALISVDDPFVNVGLSAGGCLSLN